MARHWQSHLAGPIPNHPMYEDNSAYLAQRRPQPRLRHEGLVNAELHRGCLDLLFKMQAMTQGGGELDKKRYRRPPISGKDCGSSSSTSTSSDGESHPASQRPPTRFQRPPTPGQQRLSTSRTSAVSVPPYSGAPTAHHHHQPPPPPRGQSEALAALDSDVRMIRAELEGLRHRLRTDGDRRQRLPGSQRPTSVRWEDEEEDARPPPDWIERTRRRREVEEEVTYRRPDGGMETFRRTRASPDRSVRFEASREEEIAALRAREKELQEQRVKEEEEIVALRAHRKALLKEERRRKTEEKEKKKKDKEEEDDDPDRPEGYRRVPDEERRAMLDLMLQAEAEVRQSIGQLPVYLDTFRSRQRKKDLEAALDELQGAIAVYAQRKVYIRKDA